MTATRSKTGFRAVCTGAVLTMVCVGAWAADDAVKARQIAMKNMGVQLKAIKGIIDHAGNTADVIAPSNKIADIAAHLPALFPTGSDHGDTEAKPEIWQDWGKFTQNTEELQNEARMLASAGQSGDLAIVRAQFDKTANLCGDCHREFRHRRQ